MSETLLRDENTYRFILDEKTRKRLFLNARMGTFCLRMILLLIIAFLLPVLLSFLFLSVFLPSLWSPEVLEILKIMWSVTITKLFLSPGIGFFWFLLFIGLAFLHSNFRKINIVVDKKGVRFHGFLFRNIEKHYEWHEFVQIRSSHFRGNAVIVFIDRYGRSFRIQFGKEAVAPGKKSWRLRLRSPWRNEGLPSPFFVGDGHPFSLPEVIEQFHAPVTPLDEAERRKIPALTMSMFSWDVCIAGRAAHLALAMLCLLFLNIVLRLHCISFLPLETWQSRGLILGYWLAGSLGFVFSWHYLRDLRKERWEVTWIVSLSFAACLWFLVTPLSILLPVYLGEARQETFFVPRAQDALYANRQYWHSVNEPERLSFWVEIPHKERQYKPGAQREFTVYRGPLGFYYAMPFSEIKFLWTEKQETASKENKGDVQE
jgi:hypothetical protein